MESGHLEGLMAFDIPGGSLQRQMSKGLEHRNKTLITPIVTHQNLLRDRPTDITALDALVSRAVLSPPVDQPL